jgi:hypothetical protein
MWSRVVFCVVLEFEDCRYVITSSFTKCELPQDCGLSCAALCGYV